MGIILPVLRVVANRGESLGTINFRLELWILGAATATELKYCKRRQSSKRIWNTGLCAHFGCYAPKWEVWVQYSALWLSIAKSMFGRCLPLLTFDIQKFLFMTYKDMHSLSFYLNQSDSSRLNPCWDKQKVMQNGDLHHWGILQTLNVEIG